RVASRGARDALTCWYWWRGQESLDRGQPGVARWYLDRVAAARPDDPWPLIERAAALDRLGLHAEAERDRRRAVELGAPGAYVQGLAEEAAHRGEIDRAIALAELAADRGVGAEGLTMLAGLYGSEGRWAEAITPLEQARRHDFAPDPFATATD